MFLVWLLMLQKHIQKPITYISLFLLGLIRRALTQALIPHTAVLLLRHTVLFLAAGAADQMQWELLLYFTAAGSAVI